VSFDFPFNQAQVNGTVEIKARARAAFTGRGAEYVQFSVDGSPVSGEITGWGDEQSGKYDVSGFRVLWDSTRVADGAHTITARGHNNGQDASVSITVTVNNAAAPKPQPQPQPRPNGNTRQTTPTTRTTSSIGTLNVLSQGNLYILGKGFLGRNSRVIRLFAGTYTVYAVSPSSGRVCWSRRTTITGGKTTLMRISGISCR
jgi:hypothetical protein